MHHTLSDGLTTPLWKGRAIDLNLHLRKLETNSCLVWSKNWPCEFPTTQAIFFTGRGQIFILRGGSWLRWSVKIWQPNIVGGNWLIWRLLLGCKTLLVFWLHSVLSYVKPISSHEVIYHHRKPLILNCWGDYSMQGLYSIHQITQPMVNTCRCLPNLMWSDMELISSLCFKRNEQEWKEQLSGPWQQ